MLNATYAMFKRNVRDVWGWVLMREFVEVAEAAGHHDHDEKEKRIVRDVDQCGSGHGVEGDAHGGENERDEEEDDDRAVGRVQLAGMQAGEGDAGEYRSEHESRSGVAGSL